MFDPPSESLDNLWNYETTKDQPIHENLNNYNTIYSKINLKGSNIKKKNILNNEKGLTAW